MTTMMLPLRSLLNIPLHKLDIVTDNHKSPINTVSFRKLRLSQEGSPSLSNKSRWSSDDNRSSSPETTVLTRSDFPPMQDDTQQHADETPSLTNIPRFSSPMRAPVRQRSIKDLPKQLLAAPSLTMSSSAAAVAPRAEPPCNMAFPQILKKEKVIKSSAQPLRKPIRQMSPVVVTGRKRIDDAPPVTTEPSAVRASSKSSAQQLSSPFSSKKGLGRNHVHGTPPRYQKPPSSNEQEFLSYKERRTSGGIAT